MRAAVFLAATDGNIGMHSVDLAAPGFFLRHNIDFSLFVTQHDLRQFSFLGRTHGRLIDRKHVGAFAVKLYTRPSDLDSFTHIVYWGDFQNNPQWGLFDFAEHDTRFKVSPSQEAAFARWSEIYMLNEDLVAGRPAVSVGNNFMSMSVLDKDDLASMASSGAYSAMSAIFPRDPISTEVLTENFPQTSDRVKTGLDAAFLLNLHEVIEGSHYTERWHSRLRDVGLGSRTPIFTYFFARSRIRNPTDMIAEIEQSTGCQGRPLPAWFGVRPPRRHRAYQAAISQILDSRFVISDTYHVCVNAINAGAMTFSLAHGETKQTSTLSDYKKVVLFKMLRMESQLLKISSRTLDKSEIENVARMVAEKAAEPQETGHHVLSTLRNRFEQDLLEALYSYH